MPVWWEHLLHIVSGHSSGHDGLPDLRELDSHEVVVERTHYIVNDRERRSQADRLYVLRHQPSTRGGRAEVAVFSSGRGVGYLPAGLSATVGPLLAALGGAAVVNGVGARRGSIRLRVEVPTGEALRAFVGENAASDADGRGRPLQASTPAIDRASESALELDR